MDTKKIFHINSYKEIGESHLSCGKTCEDNVRTGIHPVTGVVAAVVCDGAGSCSHAREGSETTAAAALELLLAQFDELYEMTRPVFAGTLLGNIWKVLEEKAEELGYGKRYIFIVTEETEKVVKKYCNAALQECIEYYNFPNKEVVTSFRCPNCGSWKVWNEDFGFECGECGCTWHAPLGYNLYLDIDNR